MEHRRHVLADAYLGALAVSSVVFLLWFHRAYSNLERLGISGLRWDSGWAVGAWFVPFLNLVRPPRIAAGVWRGSDSALPAEASLWVGVTPGVISSRWIVLLIGGVVGRFAATLESHAHTATSLKSADRPAGRGRQVADRVPTGAGLRGPAACGRGASDARWQALPVVRVREPRSGRYLHQMSQAVRALRVEEYN